MKQHSRRGVVILVSLIVFVALLGFAALAIDMSMLVSAKHQEQAAADSCVLATAWFIANQGAAGDAHDRADVSDAAALFGSDFMNYNHAEGQELTPLSVETGRASRNDLGRVVGFTPDGMDYDAVRVEVTMQLPAFLGGIFQEQFYEPQVSAIALLEIVDGGMIPFTLSDESFDQQMEDGVDHWTWNEAEGLPVEGSGDGIPEIVLYPTETAGPECGGNFGALNIALGSQGLAQFVVQVENGLTAEELETVISPYEIEHNIDPWNAPDGAVYDFVVGQFVNADGNPAGAPVEAEGNTGLSVGNGLEDALQSRIGDVVGYFIHTNCVRSGATAHFSISEIRAARLLSFDLTGNPKQVTIQPTTDQPPLGGTIEVLGLGR